MKTSPNEAINRIEIAIEESSRLKRNERVLAHGNTSDITRRRHQYPPREGDLPLFTYIGYDQQLCSLKKA